MEKIVPIEVLRKTFELSPGEVKDTLKGTAKMSNLLIPL